MSRTSIELTTLHHPPDAQLKFNAWPESSANATTITTGPAFDDLPDATATTGYALERTHTITSNSRTAVIIASVTLITAISTLLNGLTTVALPTIASDLSLPPSLLLWPSSIQALTNGCTLLLSGTLADALGSRLMYLLGCVLQAGFILGCGLSRSATQILVFRGLSGVAISFCLPSAVSIITGSFVGKRRDLAFAAMGGGQPIGFAVGLALGGVLTETVGWRSGFYAAAGLDVVVFLVALWGLPKEERGSGGTGGRGWREKAEKLRTEIDWVGALLASSSLAMLSYAFAAVTGSTSSIRQPTNVVLLVVAVTLIPAFVLWVGRQERLGRPALIPNSLWRNTIFTTICVAVFLTWGTFNALETMLTFYFQDAQGLSAIQTSLRFLPAPVSGALSNAAMGLIVHRVKANYLVLVACTLSAIAPLVMAVATVNSSYWAAGFLANVFNPMGADSLFTISNLLITSVFPSKTQALAGGVFNTISQIGKSVGLAVVAIIASSVTQKSRYEDKMSPEALMMGYRATFWFEFVCIGVTVAGCAVGLRGIGKVGHKRD